MIVVMVSGAISCLCIVVVVVVVVVFWFPLDVISSKQCVGRVKVMT